MFCLHCMRRVGRRCLCFVHITVALFVWLIVVVFFTQFACVLFILCLRFSYVLCMCCVRCIAGVCMVCACNMHVVCMLCLYVMYAFGSTVFFFVFFLVFSHLYCVLRYVGSMCGVNVIPMLLTWCLYVMYIGVSFAYVSWSVLIHCDAYTCIHINMNYTISGCICVRIRINHQPCYKS